MFVKECLVERKWYAKAGKGALFVRICDHEKERERVGLKGMILGKNDVYGNAEGFIARLRFQARGKKRSFLNTAKVF
jgi:hypothetical protein